MYQGGVGARQEADQRQNAADNTLGGGAGTTKTAREEQEDDLPGRAGAVAALPSFYSEDTPASANEMWQRLHADPLFAIKKQEVTARRTILSNPVQMQAIQKQVKQLRGGRDGNYSSEDGDRDRDRKRHREGSGRDKDRRKEKKRKKERKHRSRSRSPNLKREKSRRRERDGRSTDRRGRQIEEENNSRHGEKSDRRNRSRVSRSPSRSRSPRRSYRDDSRDRRYSRRRSRSPEYRRGQQRRHEDRKGREEGEGGWERVGSRRDLNDRREHGEEYQRDSRRNDDERLLVEENKKLQEEQENPHVLHMDGASAQGAGAHYGITYGRHVPDAVRTQDRSHLGEATRKRLEEAAQRKQQQEKEAAAERNRHRRDQQHRPGRLTEEERQRRLHEMTTAANEHDAQRHARIEEYEKVEAKEAADQEGRDHNDTGKFLQAATKNVYGTGGSGGDINVSGGGGSLADAVGRRKAFQQRGGDGGGSAFRK